MQPHGDRHHVDRQHVAHRALQRQLGPVRHGTQEIGEVVDVRRIRTTADGYPVQTERSHVGAAADHPLEALETVDVAELEGALNALRGQSLNVLLTPPWAARYRHFAVRVVGGRLGDRSAYEVAGLHL